MRRDPEAFELLNDMVPNIISKRIREIHERVRNNSLKGLRASEIQPARFYQSCLRALRNNDWEANAETLRRFFFEMGLSFFDEAVSPERTAFSAMMKLTLQFGIAPLFYVDPAEGEGGGFFFSKSRALEEYPPSPRPGLTIYRDWKHYLRSRAEEISVNRDTQLLGRLAAMFEAYHIHLEKSTLLRVGRNFLAVEIGILSYMRQGRRGFVHVRLSEWSKELGSTYYDLFEGHVGNSARIKKDFWLTMHPTFFTPIVMMTQDANLSRIFHDFMGVYLLESEFHDLIGRTRCIFMDCKPDIDSVPEKSCAKMVSSPPDREKVRIP